MSDESKKDEPRAQADNNGIAVGKIEVGGDVSGNIHVGNSFATNVKIIFQGGGKPLAVVLIFMAVVLGVILWYVIPQKETIMTGQFNVAVAEFLVQDASGKSISSEDGNTLANYVSQGIESQFAGLEKTISYKVWYPNKTGRITGNTPEERTANAKVLAKKINAYILVYGVIVTDGKKLKFQPEFYVNDESFRDASEITGSHEIGGQLTLALPFQGIQSAKNPALAGRIRALNLITMGLAYYSMDNFDDALTYFQKAATEKDWVGSGHEVAYLLIGNAYIRKDSQIQNFADLPIVEENYNLALEDNPNYGRAVIGKANVLYLQASQDKNNCDLSGLEQASVLLDQALALKDQPASANLETKVHFYLGQIALLRDACHQTDRDWLTKAQEEFTWVVDQYEMRKQSSSDYENQRSLAAYFNLRAPCEAQLCDYESLQSLASHSYARLGYIAYKDNDADGAIVWIKKSVEVASPYYQGYYSSLMGDIYAASGKKEQAAESYNDAIAIAEQNADAASLKTYQAKLSALK